MYLYSAYDYLAVLIPGGFVLFQIAIGSGRGIGEPGAGLVIQLLAAAFLIGRAVAGRFVAPGPRLGPPAGWPAGSALGTFLFPG
jgi:hypothetical protein